MAELKLGIFHENAALLHGVAPIQLKMYRNHQHFLQRGSSLPLDYLQPVVDLTSTSTNKTLFVLVPDVDPVDQVSSDIIDFVRFALNLDGPPVVNTIIHVPACRPLFADLMRRSKMFVRPAYEKLFELAMQRHTVTMEEIEKKENLSCKFLFLGTPGIGKSVFGVYWLLRLLQLKKNIAYRGFNSIFTYFKVHADGTYHCSTNIDPNDKALYFKLLDGKEQNLDFSEPPFAVTSILFASPYKENYNGFKKGDCTTHCMEPWSKNELELFSIAAGMSDEWLSKYFIVGGVPRIVFSSVAVEHLLDAIRASIPSDLTVLKNLLKYIMEYSTEAVGDIRSPHILLHFWPSVVPGSYFVKFASPKIEQCIAHVYSVEWKVEIMNLLSTPNPDLQSWRGKRFEALALMDLAFREQISMRCLEKGREGELFSFLADGLSTIRFQGIGEVKNSGFFIPFEKNFPAIDALVVNERTKQILFVQCTVSDAHPIKHSPLKEMISGLNVTFPGYFYYFVFVVMTGTYPNFQRQPLMSQQNCQMDDQLISQYVSQYEML